MSSPFVAIAVEYICPCGDQALALRAIVMVTRHEANSKSPAAPV